MATFNLVKGSKFQLNKGIQRILVGLGWEASLDASVNFDPDASAFGLSNASGSPQLYNQGSHALTYGNQDMPKDAKKSFGSADGSMRHSGDNRVGTNGVDDAEQMHISPSKLPEGIDEIAIWVTIYDAEKRKQSFSDISKAYVRLIDEDSGQELCRYSLQQEFNGQLAVQVGSFMKDDQGAWAFKAVGVGAKVGLVEILARYGA